MKWSYAGHLLEYGQMAQISQPIRLLLQIQISKRKVTNEPRLAITGSWEPLVVIYKAGREPTPYW
jgi:hypothetical protein